MAILELSPAAAVGFVTRFFSLGVTTYQNGTLSSYQGPFLVHDTWNGSELCVIDVMKGTVPTDFSGLTAGNSRSTDLLLRWSPKAGDFAQSITTTNPAIINAGYKAATASGVATWFWWKQIYPYTGATNLYNSIVGTVGIPGSGADLEIVTSTTTLMAGVLYRISKLQITFPTSWTY